VELILVHQWENICSAAALFWEASVQLQINIADILVGYQHRTRDRLKDQPGMHPSTVASGLAAVLFLLDVKEAKKSFGGSFAEAAAVWRDSVVV